jgi:hypothetical protein
MKTYFIGFFSLRLFVFSIKRAIILLLDIHINTGININIHVMIITLKRLRISVYKSIYY